MNISEEAVEAAARAMAMHGWGAWEFVPDEMRTLFLRDARIALEAAAPHLLPEVWQSAYYQGVDDERTSQANPGIAGCFCSDSPCRCIITPARVNPYRKPRNA